MTMNVDAPVTTRACQQSDYAIRFISLSLLARWWRWTG